jgi:colanic acid/amylovoran biosynthesis glycosyltransferase
MTRSPLGIMPENISVTHLWIDYSPSLFDRAHPVCLSLGVESHVVCASYIDNGAVPLPMTYCLRYRKPKETNSQSWLARAWRRVRAEVDLIQYGGFARSHFRKYSPNIAHIHFGTTAAYLIKAGAWPKCRTVVSFYGVDASAAMLDRKTLRLYREVFQRAAVIHVLCEEVRQRLQAAGCPDEKIQVANLPIQLTKIRKLPSLQSNNLRLLIPARFVEKKGHEVLLDALVALRKMGRTDIRLTCFGYGDTGWLYAAIRARSLEWCVQIVDNGQSNQFLEDYVGILSNHDIVLAPSVSARNGDDEGGAALTLVMAQAAAKPVIASDYPGVERSVNHMSEGLIVKAGDVAALAEAIDFLGGRPDLWGVFGENGCQRVTRDFAEALYVDNLIRWYTEGSIVWGKDVPTQ